AGRGRPRGGPPGAGAPRGDHPPRLRLADRPAPRRAAVHQRARARPRRRARRGALSRLARGARAARARAARGMRRAGATAARTALLALLALVARAAPPPAGELPLAEAAPAGVAQALAVRPVTIPRAH